MFQHQLTQVTAAINLPSWPWQSSHRFFSHKHKWQIIFQIHFMLPCTGETSCSLDQGWHLLNNKTAFKERLLQFLLDQVASKIALYRAVWTRMPKRIPFWDNCRSVFLSCIGFFVISCNIKVSLQRVYRCFSPRLKRTCELIKATQ